MCTLAILSGFGEILVLLLHMHISCLHIQRTQNWKELCFEISFFSSVALEFINNDIKVVKSNNNMNAYKIIYNDNKIIEEII